MGPDRVESTLLTVRVHPRSGNNRHEWDEDGSLHVWVTARPVDGAANAALTRYLAEILDLPASRVSIIRGERSALKRIRVPLTDDDLTWRLGRKRPDE